MSAFNMQSFLINSLQPSPSTTNAAYQVPSHKLHQWLYPPPAITSYHRRNYDFLCNLLPTPKTYL